MKKNLQAGLAYLLYWEKVRNLPNKMTHLRGLCLAAQCPRKAALRRYKARGQDMPMLPSAARRQARLLCLSLGLGLCLALVLSTQIQAQLAFAETCAAIRSDTLRLHIQANSNSVADQAVKLQVRDAILAEIELLYAAQSEDNADSTQPPDKASATALVLQNIPRLALAASKALTAAGVQQQVNITLETRYFDTTVYDTFTLPAGQYSALCVTLGQAQGKNWWCVLYPSLCLASASGEYTAPAENDIICGEYALRFAAVEWWQKTVTDSDTV